MELAPSLSIVITAYNEAGPIAECVRSALFAGEVIVVDGQSQDGTADVARGLGATVYVRENHPMLNLNKNFGLDQAKTDWVMSLDSDERVTPELREELIATLAKPTQFDGFRIPLRNYFWGKRLRRAAGYPGAVTRVCRRGAGRFGCDYIHQGLKVQGKVAMLKGYLDHHPARDLSELIAKLDFNTSMAAHYFHSKGVQPSLLKLLLWPAADFLYRYLLRGGFVDGVPGLVLSAVRAFYIFAWHTKLRELKAFGGEPGSSDRYSSLPAYREYLYGKSDNKRRPDL